ncbi:DUF4270 domain-containing protein [Christiangramia salexigens]|uniref:DUF4270 domain-containing protein n=1 Tax=Christiangramia salexigens TaxID=1913577 RepID=A0A1L3J624_9FLAO|nr:DUF4270 domain-containing protein [Christiangramia salexigens]APG60598.1 hypothetical protein LPB144_09370 [Christiangramia salexigens]
MKLNKLIQITATLAVVFAFIGCDEEFTEIGGEIISNPTDVDLREIKVNAYSKKINSIQTNNLTNFFLGVNEHPVYGESAASIVSQLSLSAANPTFGDKVELDSVVLKLPYFSSQIESGSEGQIQYKLDSIFGEGSFKLSVYETSYLLNDLDPSTGFEQQQKYYSDQQDDVEKNIVGEPLFVDEEFTPSSDSYVSYELNEVGDNDTITNAPALRLKLPVAFFKNKIIDKQGSDVLLNNNNFKNYFRSLLIKAETNNTAGNLILFNLANNDAEISLYYTHEIEDEDDGLVRKRGSFDLKFTGGNRFNVYKGEFPDNILQEIEAQDENSGSSNLYLKSQEGSMAVIELFEDEAEFEELKQNNWLINEANLTFYINQDALGEVVEPERLMLYDLDNNSVLIDYAIDPTATESSPANSRLTYSGKIERGEDGNGQFYKIRITEHINRVLNSDADNVKLGLVITGNINNASFSAVRRIDGVERVPAASLLTPRGTVLYGDAASDEDKRLKLRIYYTDLN